MAAETARERNRRLYGRPRIPRSHHRVMLALLSGAPGLSGYPLSRLAQVGSGTVYIALARLERLGYADRHRHDSYARHPRFTYTLTPEGRTAVMELLGLEEDGDG